MNDGITVGKWHGLTVTVIHRDPRFCTMHFELSTTKGVAALVLFGINFVFTKFVRELDTYASRDELGKRLMTTNAVGKPVKMTSRLLI